MGYTTDFSGCLTITPPLSPEQASYIQAFNGTRRMKRSAEAESLDDDKRNAVGLPLGVDAGYFVGGGGDFGQAHDSSVIDHNAPPSGQPGLWCQWTVDDEGTELTWDEGEKFYNYEEWLNYLVENFFKPWGCELDGQIDWIGEDSNDRGTIYAKGFLVEAVSDSITNYGPSWNKA